MKISAIFIEFAGWFSLNIIFGFFNVIEACSQGQHSKYGKHHIVSLISNLIQSLHLFYPYDNPIRCSWSKENSSETAETGDYLIYLT